MSEVFDLTDIDRTAERLVTQDQTDEVLAAILVVASLGLLILVSWGLVLLCQAIGAWLLPSLLAVFAETIMSTTAN